MSLPAATVGVSTAPLTAPLLGMGQAATTLYLADPQLEHLGPRVFTDNPLMDKLIRSSYRNVTSIVTSPLYVDTLLRRVRDSCQGPTGVQLLGDIADTPCVDELRQFEAVLERHDLPVEGWDRGNHSSSNAFGAINLLSRAYQFLRGLFKKPRWLERELCEACGGHENVLTPKKTFEGMHRVLHRHRPVRNTPEEINVRVAQANDRGYRLVGAEGSVPFDEAHHQRNFETFWRRCDAMATPYWECLVNYDIADLRKGERGERVAPFYLQVSEQARLPLEDGGEVPLYTISLDTQDHDHFISVWPGVSAFQVRVIETFMDQKLKENPRARFKLSAHFPTTRVLSWYNGCEVKQAFRRLLSREEVIFCTSAHTHEREVENLTERLKLDRNPPLKEVTVPSLIDHNPAQARDSKAYQDARALAREKVRIERGADGRPQLKIDMEYIGLDREDFQGGMMGAVDEALARYKREHGYLRAKETLWELRKKYLAGFLKRQARRVLEFFTVALNPLSEKKFLQYWRESSVVQNIVNNLVSVSVVTMFNEAEHLIPFLESVRHFMVADREEPADMAAEAQIQGVLTALEREYPVRLAQFDAAVARGVEASELRRFNDLFERTGVHRLPTLLLELAPGGAARAFAVLAGLEASREEYKFHRQRPTKVPNRVPTITIPV